jgi:SAM-dependent methyltransferase
MLKQYIGKGGRSAMEPKNQKLWGGVDAYERYMGRWSRKIGPLFLDWLNWDGYKDWIDIGCGTGELSAAIQDRAHPNRLVGIDTSQAFVERATAQVTAASFAVGDATATGSDDGSFDYAVSGLVLNFIPDKVAALAEMKRILRPGGTAGLYVWDYAGHMQLMRYFFDAAIELDAGAAAYDDGLKAPICRPVPLTEAFKTAGFNGVETTALDITTAFVDFDDFWLPFLGGTGSAPKYCSSLAPELRDKLKQFLRERLPSGPDGEILLAARAWGVKGVA